MAFPRLLYLFSPLSAGPVDQVLCVNNKGQSCCYCAQDNGQHYRTNTFHNSTLENTNTNKNANLLANTIRRIHSIILPIQTHWLLCTKQRTTPLQCIGYIFHISLNWKERKKYKYNYRYNGQQQHNWKLP